MLSQLVKPKPTSLNPTDFLHINPHSMVFTHIEEIEVVIIINWYSRSFS